MPQLLVTNFNIICAVFGGYFVVFNLISFVIRDYFYLSDALLSFLIGVCFGPYTAHFLKPDEYGNAEHVLLEFSRLLLGIQLVLSGIQLPHDYLRRHVRHLTILLIPVMATSWLIAGLILYLLIPDLKYLHALILGACLTPTDPILSNAIIRGSYARKYVSEPIRLLLSAEAGANDGFGYPYLFLGLYLSDYSAGGAIWRWVVNTSLYTVLLSVIYGLLVASGLRWTLKWCEGRGYSDVESVSSYGVVMAVFILGTSAMLGVDDLLACYTAGHLFTWDDWFRAKTTADSFQTTVDFLLTNSFFLFFGAIIPFRDFNLPDLPWWRFVVIAILMFIFKRLPPLLAFYKVIPDIETFQQAFFVGHFGPIGVGAIYYAGIALEHLHSQRNTPLAASDSRLLELLNPMIYFLVLSSLIVHGLSIPLYKLFVNIHVGWREIPVDKLWTWIKTRERHEPRLRVLEWEGHRKGASYFEKLESSLEDLIKGGQRLWAERNREIRGGNRGNGGNGGREMREVRRGGDEENGRETEESSQS